MSNADVPHAHSCTDRISHKQVKLSIADIDGVLRGKFVSAEKALSMLRGDQTLQFCSVIFGWDVADNLYDNGKFAGWHTGYPDITAKLGMHSSPPCRPCLSPLPPSSPHSWCSFSSMPTVSRLHLWEGRTDSDGRPLLLPRAALGEQQALLHARLCPG